MSKGETNEVDASAIREAFVAGATAVHSEWVAAAERGDEPPRGEPDFSEAASDYAALAPAEKAGGDLPEIPETEVRDIRWAVNYLLEQIARTFEAHDTMDIWRSEAAQLVRIHKHDLSKPVTPTPPSADLVTKARELGWEYDETDNSIRVSLDTVKNLIEFASIIQSAAHGGRMEGGEA